MTRKKSIAVLRGREGLWQLEASCGACRSGASCGPPLAVRSEALVRQAMAEQSICDRVYMGKPKNRCAWPLSFAWIFIPLLEDN